tara:strand:- start:1012 stop:1911 length:900 start_codon:yes stop_codon:yes gene_type:complete
MKTKKLDNLNPNEYEPLIKMALTEDLGGVIDVNRDITSTLTLTEKLQAEAQIISRQDGVIVGLEIARSTFDHLDPEIDFSPHKIDGDFVRSGDIVATLKGNAHPILTAERTALNFIQRLSGIATKTHSFVNAIKGTKAAITDTRKTTPGWRQLEKWAVVKGGGVNHRIGLYDAVLIKENHATASKGLSSAINRIRKIQSESQKNIPVFVEVERLEELDSVIKSQPDRIMLDNMSSDAMRTAVKSIRKSNPTINIEATGGFSLLTVREAAETGVDLISVGSLTHSAPAFDLTLLFKTAKG